MKTHYLALIVALFPLSVPPAEADSSVLDQLVTDKDIAEAKGKIIDKVEKSANEWLSSKAPFLKLDYLGNDDNSGSNGWALDYDWNKSKNRSKVPDTDLSGLKAGDKKRFRFVNSAVSAEVKGSYSHENTTNVNNLSSAGVSASMQVVDQGWLIKLENPQNVRQCINNLRIEDFNNNETAYNRAIADCNKPYFDLTHGQEANTYAYDFKANYKVEANKDYTEHQEVYGVSAGLVFEPYRGSILQQLNILDYPFRFITRPLWSDDQDYNPKLPSLYLALEQVDPTKNTVRIALPGGSEIYDRWNFEVAFATEVANIKNYPITFEASYRIYQEISPPAAIQTAGLDQFRYGSITIYFPSGLFGLGESSEFFLSYAHGRQPFDVDPNGAIMIGWKSNLKDLLKNLLE